MVGTIEDSVKTVTETLTHCNTLLGTAFTMDQVVGVLKDLDLNPIVEGDSFTCTIPSYRTDLNIREDIDEEIIRLLGYEDLKTTLPTMEATVGELTDRQQMRRSLRTSLTGLGLSEVVTYTLVSQKFIDNALMPLGEAVALAAPMSEERKYVRTSLMMSLLECLAYNQNHKNEHVNLFEISSVYAVDQQQERFAMVLSDSLQNSKLNRIDIRSDFFTAKGVLTETLRKLGFAAERISFQENNIDPEHFHPYRSACVMLGNQCLGVLGEIHPVLAKELGIGKAVYGELKLDLLLESKASKVKFSAINRFPAVHRDIALVVEENIKAEQLMKTIKAAGKRMVKQVEVFDVYQGEHVESGKKSIALSIVYQSEDHTLTDQEIQEVHQTVLARLKKDCQAVLRG